MAVNTLAAFVAAALVTGQDVTLSCKPCSCGAEAHGSTEHNPACDVIDVAAAQLAPEHHIELEQQSGLVRAVCVGCRWSRFGGWYSTRTAEGRRLAKQDGDMHLANPDTPAFTPAGW